MDGRWLAVLGALLLLGGAALVVNALETGGARLLLIVIIPVIVGGTPAFALGAFAILIGVALLLIGLAPTTGPDEEALPEGDRRGGSSEPTTGGFVLIGPVPILFGSFRGSSRLRWALVAIGVAATLLAILLLAATL